MPYKIDLVELAWKAVDDIISRYNDIVYKINELADDNNEIYDCFAYSTINEQSSELCVRFLPNSVLFVYEHWSFGEDFSRSWEIPYSLLELDDDEIEPYVMRKLEEYKVKSRNEVEAELARLREHTKRLEEFLSERKRRFGKS